VFKKVQRCKIGILDRADFATTRIRFRSWHVAERSLQTAHIRMTSDRAATVVVTFYRELSQICAIACCGDHHAAKLAGRGKMTSESPQC
jgi:hypothetical protein